MRTTLTSFACVAGALCTVSPAGAAVITWDAPVQISTVGDTIVNNQGTLVTAINATTTSSGSYTVNGVTFNNARLSAFPNAYANSSLYTGGNVGSDFQAVLGSYAYGATVSGGGDGSNTLSLSGLTVGEKYLVQFFVSDQRGGVGNRTEDFTAGNTSTTTPQGEGFSQTGSFVADATTQSVTITGHVGTYSGNSTNAVLNAYQVRQLPVPEPASLSLLGVGGVMMLGRRRRKNGRQSEHV